MPIHMIKLAVGVFDIGDLRRRQARRSAFRENQPVAIVSTRHRPVRTPELLDGGSLYWVIKGVISVRQRLLGFESSQDENGRNVCLMILDPSIVETQERPKKAFQGWRYLQAGDAPPDLVGSDPQAGEDLPVDLSRELKRIGVI